MENLRELTGNTDKEEMRQKLCYLFLVFLTGCLIGWVYEEIFYWTTEGMLRNRGILYGPWLSIYGIACEKLQQGNAAES